jgi:magnesium transporter
VTAPPVRFHGLSFRLRDREVREFTDPRLCDEISDPEVFSWIDLESEHAAPLLEVLDRLKVDRKVADRLESPEILPWIVERPNCVAFRLYEVDHPESYLDTSGGLREMESTRLLVVLGRDFVLTWHPRPLDLVDEVRTSCAADFRLAGRTPGFVVFLLLQRCLYDYADLNLANDNYLDALDPACGRGTRAELTRDVGIAGHNILLLKKLATSLHIVCMLLATKRSHFVSDEGRASLRDLQDNAMSVRAAVDSSRDLLDGVVGSLQAESAGRTSEVAGVLTVVSVIMLPLGLLAGMWGMNFQVLPLTDHPHGFWILLVGMVVLAAGLVWMFRRLGWIGRR